MRCCGPFDPRRSVWAPCPIWFDSPQRETVTRKKVAGLSAITETARDLGYALVPKVALS